ncbi:MAG TPA: hypothetical protein VF092_29280 [Longimicrobium sp.]
MRRLSTQEKLAFLKQDHRWRGIDQIDNNGRIVYRAHWYDQSILNFGAGKTVHGDVESDVIDRAFDQFLALKKRE